MQPEVKPARIRLTRAPLVAACCLLLSACERRPPAGSFPSSGGPPARIVSAAPNLTETVLSLGEGHRLVGVSTYCKVPDSLPVRRVGGYIDPEIESMVALQPDAVLTPPNPHLESALRNFNLKVHVVQAQWSSLAGIREGILQVGKIIGTPARAEDLVRAIDQDLESVRAAVQGLPRPRILFVIERQVGSMVVVGPGSHLDELIGVCGGVNVVTAGGPYPRLGIEAALQLAPEVILDVSLPEADLDESQVAKARNEWTRYASMPAVKAGRIYIQAGDRLVQPGPGIGETARRLFEIMHAQNTVVLETDSVIESERR